MRYHIYGIGAALVDTEIDVSDQDLAQLDITKGHMTLVDAEKQQAIMAYLADHTIHNKRSGGSAANSVIAASYFGAKTFYSCKVANDDNGNFYHHDMQVAGVACNGIEPSAAGETGKCLVLITPDAERTMLTHLGISETLCSQTLNAAAIAQTQYAYIEGYLVTSPTGRAAAIQLRETAEQHGVKTALSLSDPGMVEFFGDGLREMIGGGVDLLFCNEDEACGFTACSDMQSAAEALKKYAKTFAITCGSRGALIFDGEQLHTIASHAVKAIDSNGAGDMFAGAFLYAITHGYSWVEAGNLASRAAAEVVSHYGPRLVAEKHAQIFQEVLG
ncbi:MAG: adenosine kinase [Cellvibrionales bacterium]|jgi:sugar/nucleoside kinase (ribokinase family)|nr:adenosine kinase [Cellvibrionales bacterium]MBK8676077.1 adenosine kinase [Cellvibrionales bacterium]HRF87903.1 adenosine kinase [Pseudomonadales bacterium]